MDHTSWHQLIGKSRWCSPRLATQAHAIRQGWVQSPQMGKINWIYCFLRRRLCIRSADAPDIGKSWTAGASGGAVPSYFLMPRLRELPMFLRQPVKITEFGYGYGYGQPARMSYGYGYGETQLTYGYGSYGSHFFQVRDSSGLSIE